MVTSLAVLPNGILAFGTGVDGIGFTNPSTGDHLHGPLQRLGQVASLAVLLDGTLASRSQSFAAKPFMSFNAFIDLWK